MRFIKIAIALKVGLICLAIFSLITQTYLRQPVKLFLVLIVIFSLLTILIDTINLKQEK